MGSRESEKARRERLFDLYAANLSIYAPQYQSVFACPLCLRLLDRDSLEARDVTDEHIVPYKLGGRLHTLTCQPCNSDHGRDLDAHLIERIRSEDALAGLSRRRLTGKVRIGDGEMTVEVRIRAGDPPQYEICGIPRLSNPKLHAAAVQALDQSQAREMHLDVRLGYRAGRSAIAALRAGYLMMFSHFGYGYILHPNLRQVREQILHPEQNTIAPRAVYDLGAARAALALVNLLYSPEDLRCFLVALNLKGTRERHLGVVLPGLDAESEQIYDRWGALGGSVKGLQISWCQLPFQPETLSDPGNRGLPSQIWHDVRRS